MTNIYIGIRKEKSYYNEYERKSYSWTYYKEYKCGNCNKEINKNSKFCPHCGAKLNREVEDIYSEKARLKIIKYKEEKEEEIKRVKPYNFEEVKEKVEKIDKEIKILRDFIYDWNKFTSGSLPSNFDYCMKSEVIENGDVN